MGEGGDIVFYNRAINDGFEGIIVKDTTLPYEAGKAQDHLNTSLTH